MRAAIAFAGLAMVLSSPVAAATVAFTVTGTLDHVEDAYVGNPASEAFLAGVPLGSAYQLNFSYDTDATPFFPGAGWYPNSVTASYTLGGKTFALQPSSVSVGSDFMFGSHFSIFGNFGITPPAERLNGFYGLDLALDLNDPTGVATASNTLPTSLDEADYANRRLRLRFAGNQGETGLIFTVDEITSAVPEPASWALMLAGFGVCGASLRRSKARALRFA